MSKSKPNKKASSGTSRLSFLNDEKNQPWLSTLLEAYYIVDKGVARAIDAAKKQGRKLACAKGCSNCCRTHKDIPVYPLELVGISWYVTEKITGAARELLRRQLESHKKYDPCPFLVEGACSVHLMRPMACRQFNVFGRPCDEGEDPFYTRREDVMDPVKKYVDQAFFILLPFYGVEKETERVRIVETGAFHNMAKELQAFNWKSLVEKMDRFDMKNR